MPKEMLRNIALLPHPALGSALFAMFWSVSAWSWGELGHQTVGEIAQRHLMPQALRAVEEILGPELLATAAVWPDQAKSDPRFDEFRPYHYLEVVEGKGYISAPRDATVVMTKYPALLKDPSMSRDLKMIALRFIIHVVGDLHQPLHVNRGDDRGGNLCRISWKGSPHNLHAFWDEVLLEDFRRSEAHSRNSYYGSNLFTDALLKGLTAIQIAEFQRAPLNEWLNEAVALRPKVYPKSAQTYCDKKSKFRFPLSAEYGRVSLSIMREQILKGGLRLAALLNRTFSESKDISQKDFGLRQLLLLNPEPGATP